MSKEQQPTQPAPSLDPMVVLSETLAELRHHKERCIWHASERAKVEAALKETTTELEAAKARIAEMEAEKIAPAAKPKPGKEA